MPGTGPAYLVGTTVSNETKMEKVEARLLNEIKNIMNYFFKGLDPEGALCYSTLHDDWREEGDLVCSVVPTVAYYFWRTQIDDKNEFLPSMYQKI